MEILYLNVFQRLEIKKNGALKRTLGFPAEATRFGINQGKH